MDLDSFKVLTFDCYGTLIDWESGILAALRPLRVKSDSTATDEEILGEYARIESSIQAGEYRLYKEILCEVADEMAAWLNLSAGDYDQNAIWESITYWKPFDDTVDALRRLKKYYKLAIVSNIDNDLFEGSARWLEVKFDHVITAEQAKSYKPSHTNFKYALKTIGCSKNEILHVAQSLFHDIRPANELGLCNVWVNRRKGRDGSGATWPAAAKPGLEVPDLITLARKVESSYNQR
jgi:2-haloacid dehalogenase